jgi:choice-of-anchor C domain-containing protein
MKPTSESYSSAIRSHQTYLQFLLSKLLAWTFIWGSFYGAYAQSIINGSFEQGPVISGRLLTVQAVDSSTLTGWTVASNDLEIITSIEWPADQGNRSIDLNGVTNATLFQDVGGMTPGRGYLLSFSLSGNPFTGGDPVGEGDAIKNVRVSAGATTKEFAFDVSPFHHPVGSPVPAMGWRRESLFFTANNSTQRIEFESLDPTNSSRGPAIDNVSITQPLFSSLKLEKSTNLIEWEAVEVVPSMLDLNGKILIPSDTGFRFYRLQIELLTVPGIGSEPSSTTIASESSLKLEQSTNLIEWETVKIVPIMLNSNGNILVSSDTEVRFYRLQVELPADPRIGTQPLSTTITSGSTATLTVVASGTGTLSYQWYQGAVGTTATAVGTNSATLTTAALTATTSYWVQVINSAGSVNSTLATVTVNAVHPNISTPPASVSITSGSTATLTVAASGTAPLTYEWYQVL